MLKIGKYQLCLWWKCPSRSEWLALHQTILVLWTTLYRILVWCHPKS